MLGSAVHGGGRRLDSESSEALLSDIDDKKLRRKGQQEGQGPCVLWGLLLLVMGVFFLGLSVMKTKGVLPAVSWDAQQQQDVTRLFEGSSIVKQMQKQHDKILGSEIDKEQIKRATQPDEGLQATGRELLLAGINSALQSLMVARGHVENDHLSAPQLEEALSLFRHAADVFGSSYTGKGDEVLERDFFLALANEAMLQLYVLDCDEVDRLMHEAEHRIDLDRGEKASVALLRGYCLEGLGSSKSGLYFHLARQLSPTCHETLLDTLYQPSAYGHSDHMPRDVDRYFPTLLDLHLFRELYRQRALLQPSDPLAATPWAGTNASYEDDPYGANIAWGLHEAGLDHAHSLLSRNDFVILREFFHPYELAVLERYYRAKVEDGSADFDAALGRAVTYNDRVGMYLNHRYTEAVGHVVGKKVKHAYSFLCHYETRNGHKPHLRPHTDREDNEFTVSAQIYSDKELPLWPIYVHRALTLPARSSWRDLPPPDSVVECGVRNGDALLFLGRKHVHYRKTMPAELDLVASLLLHFVDQDFDYWAYKTVRQAKDPSI